MIAKIGDDSQNDWLMTRLRMNLSKANFKMIPFIYKMFQL